MALHSRRRMLRMIGVGMMSTVSGCAIAGSDAKVRHGLEIEVDKSLGRATNIHYSYGDELVARTRPAAISIGAFVTYVAPMRVPEEFEMSWEAPDGTKHEAKVPVRSRLPSSIENKTVVFVIMPDHVKGYVSVSTPHGQKRDRFY